MKCFRNAFVCLLLTSFSLCAGDEKQQGKYVITAFTLNKTANIPVLVTVGIMSRGDIIEVPSLLSENMARAVFVERYHEKEGIWELLPAASDLSRNHTFRKLDEESGALTNSFLIPPSAFSVIHVDQATKIKFRVGIPAPDEGNRYSNSFSLEIHPGIKESFSVKKSEYIDKLLYNPLKPVTPEVIDDFLNEIPRSDLSEDWKSAFVAILSAHKVMIAFPSRKDVGSEDVARNPLYLKADDAVGEMLNSPNPWILNVGYKISAMLLSLSGNYTQSNIMVLNMMSMNGRIYTESAGDNREAWKRFIDKNLQLSERLLAPEADPVVE